MVEPTNLIDEVDCASFFDHIDDILDWPTDDIPDSATTFPCFWSPSGSLPGCGSVLDNHIDNNSSDLSPELSVPFEDVVQLEWLSNFDEDSFSSRSLTMNKEVCNSISKESSPHQFETSSPFSVLESSSSCSSEKTASCSPETGALGRRGRARTKRPRPVTFTPCTAVQIASPSSSVTDTPNQQSIVASKVASDSENYAESRLLIRLPKQVSREHKKKKIKFSVSLGSAELNENSSPPSNQQQAVRKCMHCEITKTPQWRAGPMGPKTLCNACGVRYKSGRLFPEYRPAASPTFVPSHHSNSHRKVLEMRNKRGSKLANPEPAIMVTNSGATSPRVTILTNEMRNQRPSP